MPYIFDPQTLFSGNENIHRYCDRLPHRDAPGKMQFVTIRLADSLPAGKVAELKELIACFEEENPRPWSIETNRKYRDTFGYKIEKWIDNGCGECLLRNPEARKIISDSLEYYNGDKYELVGYVIMPNHVHILMVIGRSLEEIMRGLKTYTARKINELNGRCGKFWQKRYFDRMIRSYTDFLEKVEYMRHNPDGLPSGTYTLGGPVFES